MAEHTPDDQHEAASAAQSETGRESAEDRARRIGEQAERIGGILGRLAKRAGGAAQQAAREAGPEAERLARQAQAAARAAQPHVARAGREAADYVREHDAQFKRAAGTGAEFLVRRTVPYPIQAMVDAAREEAPESPAQAPDGPPNEDPATTQPDEKA